MANRNLQANGITGALLNKCIHQILDVARRIREVPYVTALVQLLPYILNHPVMSRYYDGSKSYHLKFTGTLIHGEPVVRFQNNHVMRGCELGDMMIVCKDYETKRQTAAFLQAKVSAKRETAYVLSGTSSLNQLDLYTKWPRFWLEDNNARTYDLYPKCADERAMHVIFRHWRQPNVMVAKSQKAMPITFPSFGVYLMQTLKMERGREFYDSSRADVWSDLIRDVNAYMGNHKFQRCKSLAHGVQFPRVSTVEVMSFMTAKFNAIDFSNGLITEIRKAVMELPRWAVDSKCFGVLTIEKHPDDFNGYEGEMIFCPNPDCPDRSHCHHI